jgi:hypothetical protein
MVRKKRCADTYSLLSKPIQTRAATVALKYKTIKKSKNKELYKIISNASVFNKACKVVCGTDAIESRVFIKILKDIIKKELLCIEGLNSISVSAASVTFNYAKDYQYFITKALKAYNN